MYVRCNVHLYHILMLVFINSFLVLTESLLNMSNSPTILRPFQATSFNSKAHLFIPFSGKVNIITYLFSAKIKSSLILQKGQVNLSCYVIFSDYSHSLFFIASMSLSCSTTWFHQLFPTIQSSISDYVHYSCFKWLCSLLLSRPVISDYVHFYNCQ